MDHEIDANADGVVEKLVNDLVGIEGQVNLREEVEILEGLDSDFDVCEGSQPMQKREARLLWLAWINRFFLNQWIHNRLSVLRRTMLLKHKFWM